LIPALMISFAVLDMAFAGFRAAAGRDGRIRKRGHYAGAMLAGAGAGALFSSVMALVTWAVLRRAAAPGALFAELEDIGARMALLIGGYAALVLAALSTYALARHEVRTLASVAILGPFTLARPWLVAAAALVGLWPPHAPAAIALTLLSCAGVLVTGVVLDWAHAIEDPAVPSPPISGGQRAVEVGRPLLLLVVFLLLVDGFGWVAAPFAGVVVFAFAILVHDLIHNALHLPTALSRFLLAVSAQFMIKSGHALRTAHVLHHQRCLRDEDEEGNVVHLPVSRLVLTGPWLAVRARWTAFRDGGASRPIQIVETAINGLVLGALVLAAWRGSIAALSYLGAVVLVTVTAPIWGAKIPHSLPGDHPAVIWMKERVGRLTPAACSVLFHELHHRSPRVPVALLALRQQEISARPPSPCEDVAPPEGRRP
jgi:hypothetical protein